MTPALSHEFVRVPVDDIGGAPLALESPRQSARLTYTVRPPFFLADWPRTIRNR